jgi:hypothetical protein
MTDRIRQAVERAVPGLLGGSTITEWHGPTTRQGSWQWWIHASGPDGGDLMLKIPRWDATESLDAVLARGERDETHAELDGLRRIELAVLASGDPGLTAVEPIGHIAAVDGILMRRLAGESLRDRVGWSRGSGDMTAIFERLGRWIKVFHDVDGSPTTTPFDPQAGRRRIDDLERRLDEASRPSQALVAALDAMRAAAASLEGRVEAVAEIHGDLCLSNVVVGRDDRVAVVDPARRTGPALVDVASVVTDVRLDRRQLLVGGRLRQDSITDAWTSRLLAGASLAGEPMIGYRLAEAAIARWVDLELDRSPAGRLGLAGGRRLLRRVVRGHLDSIE